MQTMTLKRFRRCPAVAVIAIFLSTIIAIHFYTINAGYGVIGARWQMKNKSMMLPNMASPGPKVKHVVFVKVHKAASTTLMNIFVRFGIHNNLSMMIPLRKNILNEHGTFDSRKVMPSLHRTYDILCNHIIFNKTLIEPLFPNDTRYIGIMRDPFEQTISAFMYYKYVYPIPYLWRIQAENPVSEYLKDPKIYEPEDPSMSFTNNRMSLDLGYPNVWKRNQTEGAAFIKNLEKTFQLILIAEYFDESVILMKRAFNWELKDVLYISSNSMKKDKLKFTPEDRERHEKWAWLDHTVYNHFYALFWDKVHAQGKNFFREVQTFKKIRHKWQNFCSGKLKSSNILKIAGTDWNSPFQVSGEDCSLATTEEIPLMDKVRMDFYLKLRRRGIVIPYVSPPYVLNNIFATAGRKKPTNHHVLETKNRHSAKQVHKFPVKTLTKNIPEKHRFVPKI